jgi:glycosyltransferase involved in cell wall biosynthesis
MNILFLLRLWPIYGGGETVTICLANEMVKRGHNVSIAFFIDSKNINKLPYINPDINPIKIEGISDFNEFSKEYFVRKDLSDKVSFELKNIISANNIDLIINQWWPIEFYFNATVNTKVKVIKCLHLAPDIKKVFNGNDIKSIIGKVIYPLFRFVEKEKNLRYVDKHIKYSDKFIFLSPFFLEQYKNLRNYSNLDKKLDFVYNPLVFDSFITTEEMSLKKKEVLFVGRLIEGHKQVSRILKVWDLITRQGLASEWKLTIVGDGPDKLMYENTTKRMHLQNVFFEGRQDSFPYYKTASIFVMTSAYEGLAMTLLESQQNGVVPVVMDTFLSLHDIIEHKKNGIITEDGNIDSFAKELIMLMQDDNKRNMLATQAIESCKKFNIEVVVDKWESIFKDLVS